MQKEKVIVCRVDAEMFAWLESRRETTMVPTSNYLRRLIKAQIAAEKTTQQSSNKCPSKPKPEEHTSNP